jgi:membrane protease YdiL (CAAX protease family)
MLVNPVAPPGWYPDPSVEDGALRWWDGAEWSVWQARGGLASEVPLTSEGAQAAWEARRDHRAPWPGPAAAVALLGLFVSALLAVGADRLGRAIGLGTLAEQLVFSSLALYAGLIATCWFVERRWGTGAGFRTDFGIEYRKGDWGRGALGSLAARGMAGVAAAIIVLLVTALRGRSYELSSRTDLSWTAVAFFAVVAVVFAPVVEELFFRGLVLRSLETVLPGWAALAAQGTAFGLAHATVDRGVANLFVIVPIGITGVVLGWLARRYQRLGPSMAAHAFFNLLPVVILIVSQAVT